MEGASRSDGSICTIAFGSLLPFPPSVSSQGDPWLRGTRQFVVWFDALLMSRGLTPRSSGLLLRMDSPAQGQARIQGVEIRVVALGSTDEDCYSIKAQIAVRTRENLQPWHPCPP